MGAVLRSTTPAAVALWMGAVVPLAAMTHTLSGCVKDASGSPAPGAIVQITEVDTPSINYTLAVNPKGCYKQEVVPDGFYEVRAEVAGVTLARKLVRVEKRENVTADLQLTAKPAVQATSPPMINLKMLAAPESPPEVKKWGVRRESGLLNSVFFGQSAVDAGEIISGRVTLAGPAPEGGISLQLSVNNSVLAEVPAEIKVAAGATWAPFPLKTNKMRGRSDILVIAKVTYGGEVQLGELTVRSLTRVTVKMTGEGYGSVMSSPPGIRCESGVCSSAFADGELVTLTPLLKPGTVFGGWSGDCDQTGRVTVTGSMQCTAVLVKK
jgi:hypothetical protein